MRPRHQVSRAAIELVKRFEGYRRQAARLPDGRWTIGYGHTLSAREGAEVSETDAEALLLFDLMAAAKAVGELVFASLTQNQFDALCAFAFSVGVEEFRGSEVLKRVNEGAFIQAAYALELWRRADFDGESLLIDALVRRRAAEKLLFLTPPGDAWPVAPSAVLKAQLDRETRDTTPVEEPASLIASLHGEATLVTREDPEPEPPSAVVEAAESVGARLRALFAEHAETTPSEAAATEAAAPEPEVAREPPPPESVPAEPEPQAAAEPEAVEATPDPEPALESQAELEPAAPAETEDPMPRIVIDDTAPYEFIAPPVTPIARAADGGPLVIAALMVLGLAFFAGGVFWALNAQPGPQAGVFTPLLVGWLAGVAGVGFLTSAVFMLLQRQGRAAEGRARRG